jgi:glutamine synthetase
VGTVSDIDPTHQARAEQLAADGVQNAQGGGVDVNGRVKSKISPVNDLPNLLAGSERYIPRGISGLGELTRNEDESVAVPDVSTLVPPWDRRARMAPDLMFGVLSRSRTARAPSSSARLRLRPMPGSWTCRREG